MNASIAVPGRAERPLPASRQRGAIGLFGILTLLTGLLFTALAVDAGRLWMERRQLQSIADMAALEAAGTIGCAANLADVQAAAQAAAQRNGYGDNLTQAPNRVEIGKLKTVGGERQFIAGAAPEAVHVVATESVPASLLLGGLIGNRVRITAEATARAEPAQATFGAGSYLLRVSATGKDANLLNLLLGGLLGSSLSLDVASYQGLANANVTLLQLLQVNATVGSVEELLNANLTIREVIDMTRGAVILHDSGLSTVVGALDSLLLNTVNALDLRLGDVLNVATPVTDAAANLDLNVLDLITATLMVANKNHAISLPLGINIPGLVNLSADINIIQPPQIAVGPAGRDADGNWCTEAKTAQIDVGVTSFINVLGLATVDLKLALEVAQGTAHLKTLVTQAGAAQAVIGATPGIASVMLTNQAGTGPASVSLLFDLIQLARIGINLPIQPGNATDLNYDVSTPIAGKLPITQSVSSSLGDSLANALKSPDALDVELLVIPGLGELLKILSLGLIDLDDILDTVLNSVLSPLLGMLGEALLDPLLRLLGIQLGGLDVTLHDIKYRGGAQLVI
ncbi:MAG: TadG family pilus assembly protein [Dechloromonas sp.]|nr:TadG family pilus assembly protein [Dechloromonas sp.]